MIGIVRDVVRAGLVLFVLAASREILREPPPPPVAWQPAPVWQPVAVPQERPIRRVASSVVDLAESVLGVIR